MAEVKKRSYRSTARAEKAASTRAAILDAAFDLFEASGYDRTTTAAIAARAGVSEAMVFAAFRSKAGVLQALIGRAVSSDGHATGTLADQPAWKAAAEAADPKAALAGFARLTADVQARTWTLIELSRTASDTDEAMANLVTAGAANRRSDCRSFAEQALKGRLRHDVTFDESVDVLWTYSAADVYRLLVDQAGWTHERYTTWLSETLTRTLTA